MITLDTVTLEIEGPKATVVFNRADKKNSMNPQMHRDMTEVLNKIEEADGVKVVVFTGSGDSFCAGMDLEECFLEPYEEPMRFYKTNLVALEWFQKLKAFPAVTIAKVNGFAFGLGVEVTGLCDLAVASEDVKFGLSEINFGIFPAGGATWAMAHNLPRKQALYYILTGATFSGTQAEQFGLVNRAVPADQLDETVEKFVGKLVKKNEVSLTLAKQVYEHNRAADLPASIDYDQAKLWELARLTDNEWINVALSQFKKRSYRPGLDTYKSQGREVA